MPKQESYPLFYEANSEADEKDKRAHYAVSVLGGDDSEKDADELGYKLTKESGFSVTTGGYAFGAMKGALEGSNRALNEMGKEITEAEKNAIGVPQPKGIVAERFNPEKAATGKHIKTEIAEGEHDLYLRLGKLIENGNISIVLPGNTGTELEIMANLHFDKKIKSKTTLKQNPVIFVGNSYNDFLKSKFEDTINKSQYIFMVENVTKANELADKIFKLEYLQDNLGCKDEEKNISALKEEIEKKLLRFEN